MKPASHLRRSLVASIPSDQWSSTYAYARTCRVSMARPGFTARAVSFSRNAAGVRRCRFSRPAVLARWSREGPKVYYPYGSAPFVSLSLSLSLSRCQISNQRSGEISDRRESVAGLARVGSRSIGADTGESKVAASVQQDAFYNSSMLYSRRCRRRTIPGSGATSRAIQADRSSIDSAHSRRLDRDTFVFE